MDNLVFIPSAEEYEALLDIVNAATTIDADLSGNADNRIHGGFILIEEARVRLLLKALHEYRAARTTKRVAQNTHIEIINLEFSIRVENCLRSAGIKTVEDLVNKTRKDLLKIKGLGQRSLNEITDMLHDMGLTLKPDGD